MIRLPRSLAAVARFAGATRRASRPFYRAQRYTDPVGFFVWRSLPRPFRLALSLFRLFR